MAIQHIDHQTEIYCDKFDDNDLACKMFDKADDRRMITFSSANRYRLTKSVV